MDFVIKVFGQSPEGPSLTGPVSRDVHGTKVSHLSRRQVNEISPKAIEQDDLAIAREDAEATPATAGIAIHIDGCRKHDFATVRQSSAAIKFQQTGHDATTIVDGI